MLIYEDRGHGRTSDEAVINGIKLIIGRIIEASPTLMKEV